MEKKESKPKSSMMTIVEFTEGVTRNREEIMKKLSAIGNKEEQLAYLNTLDFSDPTVSEGLLKLLTKSVKQEEFRIADAINTFLQSKGINLDHDTIIGGLQIEKEFVPEQIPKNLSTDKLYDMLQEAGASTYSLLCYIEEEESRIEVLRKLGISRASFVIIGKISKIAEKNNNKEILELLEKHLEENKYRILEISEEISEEARRNKDKEDDSEE